MGRRRKAPKKSHSIMVLDRSGSMMSRKSDTEGGYDAFIGQLRADADENTFVTLIQFDTEHDTVYSQRPVREVPKLVLQPRGGTALLDAVGIAIRRAEKFVRKGDNVVVTILTDGHENSSREFTKEAVTALMDEKREDGWEFNFLGAGPHAWSGATLLGIGHDYTINYSGSGAHTQDAFAAAALSNVAKTRGLSSSYTTASPIAKAALEDAAGVGAPDVQINIAHGAGRPVLVHARPRRRGSGKNLKS